jgi:hypothetical protein
MRNGVGMVLALVFGMSLTCEPAWGHHATTMFDYTKVVTLTGTVREFQWTNPHSYLQLAVPNNTGGLDEWSIEVGTPNVNARMGWRKDSLKSGDKITITFCPLKDGQRGGTLKTATLADGRVLFGVANIVKTDAQGNPVIGGQGLPSLAPTPEK